MSGPHRTLGRALLVVGCAAVAACASPPAPPTGAAAMAGSPAQATTTPVTLADLIRDAASLQGRLVTVTARFGGWNARCAGPPPRSRSDWMLVDGTHCVYVNGAVPDGIAPPPDTASNGKTLTVLAVVRQSDEGRLFLQRP